MPASKQSGRPKRPPRKASSPGRVGNLGTAAAAWNRVKTKAMALPPEAYRRVNIDVPGAAAMVMGAHPRLLRLSDALDTLPVDHKAIASLPDLAQAALYTHLMSSKDTSDEKASHTALLEELNPLRKRLLTAAEMLAAFDLVDKDLVAGIRSGQGHEDTANDAIGLAALFDSEWKTLEGKTPVTLEEIRRAAELGPKLLAALADRSTPDTSADWPVMRAAVFTLLVDAYAEARRAVAFLRYYEGDADTITPSLFAQRKRKSAARSSKAEEIELEDEVEAPGVD